MNCPYFKESYFGICLVQVSRDSIHVPSIDEMERFCFRSWYFNCPKIPPVKEPEGVGRPRCANGHIKIET